MPSGKCIRFLQVAITLVIVLLWSSPSSALAQSEGQSEGDLQKVVSYQPRLRIQSDDEARNDAPIQIGYCVTCAEDAAYYTYVYIWTFSDTPWWGELLGYPDHNWDYEPIIVRIDNEDPEVTYFYDKGHYRAGSTTNGFFNVEKGSHRFIPVDSIDGTTFSAESFKKLTARDIEAMNKSITALPRLPFGRKLSLDWACDNPAKVGERGAFSTDEDGSMVPPQTNALGGTVVGMIAATMIGITRLRFGVSTLRSWPRTFAIGVFAGILGGIVGGVVAPLVHDTIDGRALGVLAAVFVGALGSVALYALARCISPRISGSPGHGLSCLCGALGALLTGIW